MIAAVIVTWNGEACIRSCLESLQMSELDLDVIVVDNASSDRTLEIVRSVAAGATVIPLNRNLGFGRANNIGLKHAYEEGADSFLLLNQDVYFEKGSLARLVGLQRRYPEYGILSPLHIGRTTGSLDTRFAAHLAKSSTIGVLLSHSLVREELDEVYSVDFVNAAAWLISRRCVEQVGLFNPAFPHYGEDKEYTDRVRTLGFQVGVTTRVRVIHDRPQDPVQSNLQRHLMVERAQILYRLSRTNPSRFWNLQSALYRALMGPLPREVSRVRRLSSRVELLGYVAHGVVSIWRRQKEAYNGNSPFFCDAEVDARRFIKKFG